MFKSFISKVFPKLTVKAANIEGNTFYNQYSPYQIISGDNYRALVYTPVSLVRENNHWVSICNNKNANIIATTPLKLYYKKSKSKKLLTPHKQLKSIDLKKLTIKTNEDQDLVEIVSHPFLDLMNKVNDTMNYTDLISLVQQYLGLIGNAYVRIEKDDSGIPVALYPLLSEYVTIMLDVNGNIESYKYCYNGKDTIYSIDEIIHFNNYQVGSIVSGRGELESCIAAVNRYNYYDNREAALNKNNARPDFIVSFKQPLNEQEQKDIVNAFHKKFGTVKNSGKPLITSECTILPIGFSPLDMDYKTGREWARNEIINSFGVPESLVSLNNANYASASVSHYQYMVYTIIPKLRKMCEKINEKLLPMYDENLLLWYDEDVKDDKVVESQVLNSYVASGVMSIDEARNEIGLEPKVI